MRAFLLTACLLCYVATFATAQVSITKSTHRMGINKRTHPRRIGSLIRIPFI